MYSHRPQHTLAVLMACAGGLGLAPVARGLLSPSPAERAQYTRDVIETTDAAVAEAIRVLERDDWSDRDSWLTREAALKTLGHLRAESGIDILMRHLDYQTPLMVRTEWRPLTPGDYFPALQALTDIGSASSTRIVRELRQFSLLPVRDRNKLFWVLSQIEGRHPGCFLIERELAQLEPGSAGDKARAELSEALAEFETYELHPEYPSRLSKF